MKTSLLCPDLTVAWKKPQHTPAESATPMEAELTVVWPELRERQRHGRGKSVPQRGCSLGRCTQAIPGCVCVCVCSRARTWQDAGEAWE